MESPFYFILSYTLFTVLSPSTLAMSESRQIHSSQDSNLLEPQQDPEVRTSRLTGKRRSRNLPNVAEEVPVLYKHGRVATSQYYAHQDPNSPIIYHGVTVQLPLGHLRDQQKEEEEEEKSEDYRRARSAPKILEHRAPSPQEELTLSSESSVNQPLYDNNSDKSENSSLSRTDQDLDTIINREYQRLLDIFTSKKSKH